MPPAEARPDTVVDLLVLGGGIAGLTTALEAADAGCRVMLVEKSPFLGGRVARLHQYFPKLCPPACGLEINYRRLRDNPRVQVRTLTRAVAVAGTPGNYAITLESQPRFVTGNCTGCGECVDPCPAEGPGEFDYGMAREKAVSVPRRLCFPQTAAIDRAACPAGCRACKDACRYDAIVLDQPASSEVVGAAAVVAATGWTPYDAARLETLGYRRYPNVITNVMMERLAAPDGPTGGRILRPSDGAAPRTVGFVQCAGSRDENHLPYCSAVCCAASLKQAGYVRASCPDAAVSIFYIDIRTPGRLEELYTRAAADPGIEFVKGKVAQVEEGPASRDLLVDCEDVLHARKTRRRVELLVLATGVVPQTADLPAGFHLDEFRFVGHPPGATGLYAVGCARQPADVATVVRDATGAALRALQCSARSARHG